MSTIKIGVSACLQGQAVRYDGSAKRKQHILTQLAEHMTLESVCPEISIGLPVPRATIRLVGDIANTRLVDSKTQTEDQTDAMIAFADKYAKDNTQLSGYIGVKQSPSCGYDRVKRYNDKSNIAGQDTKGLFIQQLLKAYPLLPIEEDGRLNDAQIRENFVKRVYTYHQWQQLVASGISHKKLQQFWVKHKYSLMAHDIIAYQEIGKLLANTKKEPLETIAETFITLLMNGLKKVATRKKNANVLHHIAGYLKRDLASSDKQELDTIIHHYREQQVPLIVPITMLKHHLHHHKIDYIEQQMYMQPYPETLALRNTI